MSKPVARRPKTSAERSPLNSISPAIARSRQDRRLSSKAAPSPRSMKYPPGSRRCWHTRSRGAGLPGPDVPASRPVHRPPWPPLRATGHRVDHRGVARRGELEQPRYCCQSAIDCRGGVPRAAAVGDRV